MNQEERAPFEAQLIGVVRHELDDVASIGVEPTDLTVPHFLMIHIEPIREGALDAHIHMASDAVLNVTAGNQHFDLAARSPDELIEYLTEFLRSARAGRVTETVWQDRKDQVYRSILRVDFGTRIETFRYFDLRDFPLWRRQKREIVYLPY